MSTTSLSGLTSRPPPRACRPVPSNATPTPCTVLHPSVRKQRREAEAISHTDIKRQARNAPQRAEQKRRRVFLVKFPVWVATAHHPKKNKNKKKKRATGKAGWDGTALKIMNARFAFLFVRGVSPSSLPLPDRPSVRLSLPWRLKSDPLSLYFSLSMAPATATTNREVHHCDKQVALLTVGALFHPSSQNGQQPCGPPA